MPGDGHDRRHHRHGQDSGEEGHEGVEELQVITGTSNVKLHLSNILALSGCFFSYLVVKLAGGGSFINVATTSSLHKLIARAYQITLTLEQYIWQKYFYDLRQCSFTAPKKGIKFVQIHDTYYFLLWK